MSEYKKISHKKGVTPAEYFIVKDSNGDAIDIQTAGWAVDVSVKESNAGSVIETFTTGNGKIVLSSSVTGRYDFSGFDGSEFTAITFRGYSVDYIYDVQLTDDSGNTYDAHYGEWTLINNL